MQPQLIVDCPSCHAPNTVDMLLDEHDEGHSQIAAMFGVHIYSFSGNGRCIECNNPLTLTLTVAGGMTDESE